MKLRFKLAWQNYRVGDVIEPSGLLKDWLVGCGYCEPVVEEKPKRKRKQAPSEPSQEIEDATELATTVEPL